MTTPRSPVPRRVAGDASAARPSARAAQPLAHERGPRPSRSAAHGVAGAGRRVGSSRRSPGFFRKALGELLGHPVGFFEGEHGAPARHGGAGAAAVDGRGHGQQGFALQRLGGDGGAQPPSAACRGKSRSLAAPCAPGRFGALHWGWGQGRGLAQAAPGQRLRPRSPPTPSRQQRSSAARHGPGREKRGDVSCRHRGSVGRATQVAATAFSGRILSRVGSADLELSQGRAGR